jgi:hypothetical protein
MPVIFKECLPMLNPELNPSLLSSNHDFCCVVSGFRRLMNDVCALLDVQQHRLMVTDCLTFEDETDNLSQTTAINYQSTCVTAQKSEDLNDVLVDCSTAFSINSRLFSVD